ncbi:hypothetical protein [Luteimonas sp. YGD11-2]|uniref:hypothetical protein n=1 Tax=Luteimonas sp. YGD11-2 TaxID=2508168 RepID=UPI00100A90DB|nr:hypothetical protein [Luteimonas sp. YGD11-2]
MARHDIPLWLLPLAVALVFLLGTHAAWALSVHAGIVPGCIPYLEGCTSISRAAREGVGNHLFRLLMLPNALAIGLHWWLSARWLSATGARGRTVLGAGLVAAVALAVYVTFLGTEGEVYRFLRRYGVVVFFGASFLAQVAFLRAGDPGLQAAPRIRQALRAICALMLLLGVVHVIALVVAGGSPFQDHFENALEWWLGLGLVTWFLVHAWLWKRAGYRLRAA